jgi:peptidoglycan/xylan/chitin deacetylase (PgdA/CDA1 family)
MRCVRPAQRRGGFAALAALLCAALLSACATAPLPGTAPMEAPLARLEGVVATNDKYVVYMPVAGETYAALAKSFLGSEARQWEIADFNGPRIEPGKPLTIPLKPANATGVTADGYQVITILCYHRVGPRVSRMVMAPDNFAAQLDYLAKNNYRVIRLADLPEFLSGKRPLPKRAVVITFDDGHVSAYEHAYPLLKKYGFPATFFLYTDFLGAAEALSWPRILEMAQSGLIDFQSHSKTHSNLTVRLPGETEARYRERLDAEVRVPRDLIQRQLQNKVGLYAYPYGDANDIVIERLQAGDQTLGATVNPGGNPFFAHPFMLRRTMIFGEHDMSAFRGALQTFRDINLR